MNRILFVDDDVDLPATMKILLRQKGFAVAVTTSCKHSLDVLRIFHPDLILLDNDVSDEDGRLVDRQLTAPLHCRV
jgi:DNA-binding response OmpR family regulator